MWQFLAFSRCSGSYNSWYKLGGGKGFDYFSQKLLIFVSHPFSVILTEIALYRIFLLLSQGNTVRLFQSENVSYADWKIVRFKYQRCCELIVSRSSLLGMWGKNRWSRLMSLVFHNSRRFSWPVSFSSNFSILFCSFLIPTSSFPRNRNPFLAFCAPLWNTPLSLEVQKCCTMPYFRDRSGLYWVGTP